MSRLTLAALLLMANAAIAAPGLAAPAAGPLVDSPWLAEHSCDGGIVVLDLRGNRGAFLRARIPCSVHGSYFANEWRVTRDGVPGMLPDAERLSALVGSLGIGNDDHVVIVGPGGSPLATTVATRVYWTFKVAGHDAVSLLDGGFAAYGGSRDLPIEKGEPAMPARKTFAVSFRADLLATADDVARAPQSNLALIDNRDSDHYVGINKSGIAARAGTLPGAENVPITWLTAPDGSFQSDLVLQQIADQTALSAINAHITFCNTGQMASLGWFVSYELLGNSRARLYDGSMAQWSADPARAVEQRIKTE